VEDTERYIYSDIRVTYINTVTFIDKQVLSEHKHCDNAATNANSENVRSRMEATSAGKRGYGDKGQRVRYWSRLGCWISPVYDPFSLGGRFETYEPIISLIFQFFFSCGKPRVTQTADMGARLYTHTNFSYIPLSPPKKFNRLGWLNHKCAQQGKVIGIYLKNHILKQYSNFRFYVTYVQWRTEGGFGVFKTPSEIPKF
jgi:hypothetical protein